MGLPAALHAGDWHAGREVLSEGGFVWMYGISLVMRMIEQWSRLPGEVVESLPLKLFKTQRNKVLTVLVYILC